MLSFSVNFILRILYMDLKIKYYCLDKTGNICIYPMTIICDMFQFVVVVPVTNEYSVIPVEYFPHSMFL